MSYLTWRRQLVEMRAKVGIGGGDVPTVFVCIIDSSVPAPEDAPSEELDLSDAALVGYRTKIASAVGAQHFERLPGEALAKFQRRVEKAAPDVRIFWPVYRCDAQAA